MYKDQLKKWKIGKYASRDDWLAAAKILQASSRGLDQAEVLIHQKVRRLPDLRRWLRSQADKEDDFLAEAQRLNSDIPEHIHEYNPTRSPQRSMVALVQDSSASATATDNRPTSAGSHFFLGSTSSTFKDMLTAETARSPEDRVPDPYNRAVTGQSRFSAKHSMCVAGITDSSVPWQDGPNDERISGAGLPDTQPRIAQDECEHIPNMQKSLETTVPGDPIQWFNDPHTRYIVGCEHAAVCGTLRMTAKKRLWLNTTFAGFRQLCYQSRDIALIAASTMLTWLQIHVNEKIAEEIMETTYSAAREVLSPNHPISLLLEWMLLAVSAQDLSSSKYDFSVLRRLWFSFLQENGNQHYHTMVALYVLCFHLLLVDKSYSEAENHLEHLVTTSIQVLGPFQVFTVNVLATLSRAQLRQNKLELALVTIDRALAAAPYGLNHPHRLELLLRKAIILWKLNRRTETEDLYWTVARGRIATLGVHHEKTLAAHGRLIDVLQLNGTWDAKKDNVHNLLIDPDMAVKEHEAWWKTTSEALRREREELLSDDSDV
jgi:hypothetical protein